MIHTDGRPTIAWADTPASPWDKVREFLRSEDSDYWLVLAVDGSLPKHEACDLLLDSGIEPSRENLRTLAGLCREYGYMTA